MPKRGQYFIWLVGLMVVVGCGRVATPPPSLMENTAVAATSTPTLTLITTPTWEPLFTSSPQPTPTRTPTLIPSPSVEPTLSLLPGSINDTPIPATVMPDATAEALIMDLLANNAGCPLPCWWGIVPGETTWAEAYTLLTSLGARISSFGEGHAVTVSRIPSQPGSEATDLSQGYWTNGDIVQLIVVLGIDHIANIQAYYLGQILRDYGLPSEVWINANTRDMDTRPFRLLVVYRERGFALLDVLAYHGFRRHDSQIIGCAANENDPFPMPNLYLTDPEPNEVSEALLQEQIQLWFSDQHFLPLEEATDLTIPLFYDIFSQTDTDPCLESPIDLWDGY